ncbi:XdhC family protein [Bartonella sp. LJL80]
MITLSDIERLNLLRLQRRPVFVVHDFAHDLSTVYAEDDVLPDNLIPFLNDVKRKGQATLLKSGGLDYFITPYLPLPRIIIVGAVHIAQFLAPMARQCGYDLVVLDPRQGFASSTRFPDTLLAPVWPIEYFGQHPIDPYDALVALTHNPDIDDEAIIHAITNNAFYIGALGSRKTHAKRRERLEQAGLSVTQLDTIHAPIGLDIAAVTPQEIAVAIVAEVIQCWRKPKD